VGLVNRLFHLIHYIRLIRLSRLNLGTLARLEEERTQTLARIRKDFRYHQVQVLRWL
jgi:hypothetical protein